ncbi:GNAT family N-acetyltransferase [Winogradskyella marincola]|uniref:GNAT family N-acetyltransferase n=1 Tax=Winogradskyella marincola TaxID=3037795 RepID=A0ABT6FXU8_9FLAO|nr:GNAT family N-acetyltransferase [Winogradskyella sp. YYF002]MDG4714480.1 GNAT family N-acetyltransferase [Winogradskyella sp. YYF002]
MDYHNDRFQDFSLMIYKDEKLIALMPANKVDDCVYSHQGLTYGGFIYKSDLKSEDVINLLKAVLNYLLDNKIKTLELKELPIVFLENQTNNPLAYLCFKLKAQLVRVDMHSVVDLKFKAYNRSRKNGYKRGQKNNLVVKEVNDFEDFWNKILIPNLDNKHDVKPVHSLEEIQLLKTKFPNKIRQFNVYHNNIIVAGTTIFETKHVAHSQYISGNTDKNTLGSLDFLHHHLLEDVFASKSYFNFGISNLNQGQNINQGLLYWKEGFGSHSITQSFYKFDTVNVKLLNDLYI